MTTLFTKRLSKTDVEKRLAIPTSSLEAFKLKGASSVVVKTEDMIDGTIWSFHCTTRTNIIHKKPVLSRGWRQFAKYKELREGDRVALYKGDEAQVPYRIEVEREIKLWGQLMWGKF